MRDCLESPKGSMASGGGQRRVYTEGSQEVRNHPAPRHQKFHWAYHKDAADTIAIWVILGM